MKSESLDDQPIVHWGPQILERKRFGNLLLSCLKAEAVYAQGSFVVALTAPFGSGKTHFLKAWVTDIKGRRAEGDESMPRVITLNAWDTDFSGEPLLAIIATVLKALEGTPVMHDQGVLKDLKSAGYGLLAAGTKIAKDLAVGYLEEKTGVPIDSALTSVSEGSPSDKLERKASQLLADFETRQRSLLEFKLSLKKLIKKEEDLGLLLVVDELDRCKPTYAIEFLEALKHVFDVDGLGILLAVDWDQLNSTATALFGASLNSEEYLRKFIHRRAELPKPDVGQLAALSDDILQRFFNSTDPRQPLNQDLRSMLSSIVSVLELSPRQIETTAFILARLYFYKHLKEGQRLDLSNRMVLIPELFMACVYAKNRGLFDILKAGEPLEDCMRAICDIRIGEKLDTYSSAFIEGRILAGLATMINQEDFKKLAIKYGGVDLTTASDDEKRRFNVGYWPHKHHSFSSIARGIMEVASVG